MPPWQLKLWQPKEMSSRGSQRSKGKLLGIPASGMAVVSGSHSNRREQAEVGIKGKPGRGRITLPWTISQGRDGHPKAFSFPFSFPFC